MPIGLLIMIATVNCKCGPVDQLGRSLPWHGRGLGFESRPVHLNILESPKRSMIFYYHLLWKLVRIETHSFN